MCKKRASALIGSWERVKRPWFWGPGLGAVSKFASEGQWSVLARRGGRGGRGGEGGADSCMLDDGLALASRLNVYLLEGYGLLGRGLAY